MDEVSAAAAASRQLLGTHPECYEAPSAPNVAIGVFLIVGTIVSYIPQYLSIIRNQSSDGINYIMLGFALASSFFTAINAGILNWPYIICCLELTGVECLANNIATEQLLSGLLCYTLLYVVFLMYCRTTPKTEQRFNRAWWLFFAIICASIGLAAGGGILYYNLNYSSTTLQSYARTLGLISAVLMIVQWTPQIYTTVKLKSAGSLSVTMILLQLPGALLVVFFQGVVNGADFTTWAPYIFGAIQMAILVALIFAFKLRDRARSPEDGERTSLLPNLVETFDPPLEWEHNDLARYFDEKYEKDILLG